MSSRIAELFNHIAPHYDFLNHLLSLRIDNLWRRNALKYRKNKSVERALDVACGTGDFSIQLIRSGVKKVEGIDISDGMVKIAREKIAQAGWQSLIRLTVGDCAALPYPDNNFDLVTVAFGVRNFEERAKGLAEMVRVLKPSAQLIVLEFSMPEKFPVKQLYTFYFKKILPLIGGLVSGNKKAYRYLPESVLRFPQGEAFLSELRAAGLTELCERRLSCGIATVYYGTK